jgi:predicted ferric reductase
MSTEQLPNKNQSFSFWRVFLSALATIFVLGFLIVIALVAPTPAGQTVMKYLTSLFALDSVQIWWYVTRSSGIIAYMLLWFSTVLGLAVTSKFLDNLLHRVFTYDFHQYISWLAIVFTVVHVAVLMLDRFLPYSVWQVLIPFISPYRPFWIGVGVLAFYITLLVTVTFYIRNRIGSRAFRTIHILSLVGYLGVTLHGYYGGTDTPLPAMKLLYDGTALVVIFFTVYWLVLLAVRKAEARSQKLLTAQAPRKRQHTPLDSSW